MVPMVTAPVFTWTGFYVGGNVGYSWGDWNRAGLAGGTGISKPSVDGWLLGIQGGYNWQISPIWVRRSRGDFQVTGQKADEFERGPVHQQHR
jgi:outer membrane immunogenic protein